MLCFSAVNSYGVICRVQSITIKESFKPPYRCQRIKLQAGEVLWRHWCILLSVCHSTFSHRALFHRSHCPLHVMRIKVAVWVFSGLIEFNPDEKIPGQRKTSYDFNPNILHLTCHHHLLNLLSELAETISFFRHFTYPDIHISEHFGDTGKSGNLPQQSQAGIEEIHFVGGNFFTNSNHK